MKLKLRTRLRALARWLNRPGRIHTCGDCGAALHLGLDHKCSPKAVRKKTAEWFAWLEAAHSEMVTLLGMGGEATEDDKTPAETVARIMRERNAAEAERDEAMKLREVCNEICEAFKGANAGDFDGYFLSWDKFMTILQPAWEGETLGYSISPEELAVRLIDERDALLAAVQLAYRKHHMGDADVGWDELSDKLLAALCEAMGDKGFQEWLREVSEEGQG